MALFKQFGRRAKLAIAVVLALGIFTPSLLSENGRASAAARVDQLEIQTENLNRTLGELNGAFDLMGLTPPAQIGGSSRLVVAQSRDVASLNLRVSGLEEQMRVLVGQMEGLQFQMAQFQTLIERLQVDTDFRFQQLEGGGSGKTNAVIQPGGDVPTGGLPQTQNLTVPLDLSAPLDLGAPIAPPTSDLGNNLDTGDILNIPPTDFVFGTNPDVLDNSVATVTQNNRSFELIEPTGSLLTDSDADAQYRAGFEAVIEGDYVFAETQFRQFVALFPNHARAPDATNWLGEALLQRQQYDEAAQILFDGFQLHQNTTRAPDLLFKLGIALAGAGERDTACRTFDEVLLRYPDMPNTFIEQVNAQIANTQC